MGKSTLKTWLWAALSVVLLPCGVHAAGLGKLTILSSLGQPLQAEIELVAVRKDELPGLVARLSSPDAFAQAKIPYSAALMGVRLSIERKPNGQPYIKIVSGGTVNEPFVDMLVELTWPSGRIVREYTALIDPPGFAPAQPVAPVAVAEAKPAPLAVTPPPASTPVPASETPARPPASAASTPAPDKAASYGPVKRGETLRKIAQEVKPPGVTLEQMLVGLYRNNKDAFIDNNMNRMRTGRILRVPEAGEISAVPQPEAQKEVRVQAADWNGYRQRLAGNVSEVQAGAGPAASGKITAKVEDQAGVKAPGKEVLKLSKGEPVTGATGEVKGAKAMQDRLRSLEEEVVARDKAVKEANERVAQLEKTIQDMQKLLDIKNQGMATVQKGAETAATKSAAPAVKSEPVPPPKSETAAPKPESVPVKPEPAKPASEAAAPPTTTAPKPDTSETKPEPPKAAVVPTEQPKPKPRVVPPPPPPPPPKGLVDEILGEPLYMAGIGGALVLLGGLGYAMVRRKRAQSLPDDRPATVSLRTRQEPTAATAVPAAAAIAAGSTVPPTETTQIDEVDPLAEADVYIAYGRDAQAEEILKEALAHDPNRNEVKLKLLEIYAARKSKDDFNKVARDLHVATGGVGDIWTKTAQMGYALDPSNPIYEAGKLGSTLPAAGGPTATDIDLDFDLDMAGGPPTTATDLPLGGDVPEAATRTAILSPDAMQKIAEQMPTPPHEKTIGPLMPDFNLDEPAPTSEVDPSARTLTRTDIHLDDTPTKVVETSNVIDFNFDSGSETKEPEKAPSFTQDGTLIIGADQVGKARDLGVEIDLGDLGAAPGGKPASTSADTSNNIAFDLDLPPAEPSRAGASPLDLGTINLDLGEPHKEGAAGEAKDDHWYDVQTKFDLAKAYQEMGDKDGAKEILREVIKEGDAKQQSEAKSLLATLS